MSYLNYFKLRLINNLQYRSAAYAGIATQFFFGIVYIAIYTAFYESGSIDTLPLPYDQLVTYIWLGQAFFMLTYPYVEDNSLMSMIKNGDLSYELIRPQNLFIKYFIKMLAKRIIGTLMRCIPILVVGILLPKPFNIMPPVSFNTLIIFIIMLIISCFLTSTMNVVLMMITVYTVESRGTFTIYNAIACLFMGEIVPIPFLPKFLITISNYLPFRFFSDVPYRLYVGNIASSGAVTLISIGIIWIIVFFVLGLLLTKNILRKAVIQGG